MPLAYWKTRLRRLPANLVSNRLWIVWGGTLYVRAQTRALGLGHDSPELHTKVMQPSRTFVKWSAWANKHKIRTERVGLFPTELGMFGNMIRRMGNAFLIAQHLKLGHLIVPKGIIFYRGLLGEKLHQTRKGLHVWFGVVPRVTRNSVDALITTDLFRSFSAFEEQSTELLRDSWEALRGLLVPQIPVTSTGPNVVTIHIRSGDVFGSRKPASYGQPPFAYYQLILESRKWERVDLVYQDMSNPVVSLIMDYCRAHKLPLHTQSSDLSTDLTLLLGAENLVAGRGSFIPAVVGLSPHCTTVYYFEDKMNLIPSVPGVRVFQVQDTSGDYRSRVLSNNWQNTPEQREMMTSYPLSSLVMKGL